MRKPSTVFSFLLFILAQVETAYACDERVAKPIAEQVTYETGVMIKFTKAACAATREGQKCTILCISDLNVSGLNRDILLTFLTASAGKKMRDAGLHKFDNLTFADRELLLQRRAVRIS